MPGETILENGLVQINGSVEQVIYSNEDNGYAICDFGTDDDDLITITGIMPYVNGIYPRAVCVTAVYLGVGAGLYLAGSKLWKVYSA